VSWPTAWQKRVGFVSCLWSCTTPLSRATLVYCDNVSTVYLSTNPIQYERIKHTEINIHFVCERLAIGDVRVLHVPTTSQFVDIFTKDVKKTIVLGVHVLRESDRLGPYVGEAQSFAYKYALLFTNLVEELILPF
jgi:hypothetical protein